MLHSHITGMWIEALLYDEKLPTLENLLEKLLNENISLKI